MRISELARKYSVTPSEIVKYLEKEGKVIGSYNARLDEELVKLLEFRFQDGHNPKDEPGQLSSESESAILDTNPEDRESQKPESEVTRKHQENLKDSGTDEVSNNDPQKIEIPKPKLKGIKVVGKIEIPEKLIKKEY